MQMMCLLGAKERSADDWQKLVARMDRRLKIIRILTPTDCLNGLVEIGLEDEGLGEEEVVGAGAASN